MSNKQVQVVESYPKAFCAKAPTCQTVEREEKGHKKLKKSDKKYDELWVFPFSFLYVREAGYTGKMRRYLKYES